MNAGNSDRSVCRCQSIHNNFNLQRLGTKQFQGPSPDAVLATRKFEYTSCLIRQPEIEQFQDESNAPKEAALSEFNPGTPSMRRPVRVKTVLFLLRWSHCRWAEPRLSPSFHPQSFRSDSRSLQGGRPQFSWCCYLSIDLGSPLVDGSWARWDEKAGLQRDAIRSQLKTRSRRKGDRPSHPI